jgi:hypothetical protein
MTVDSGASAGVLSRELNWLASIVWGQSSDVLVSTESMPPPGFRVADTFTIIPSGKLPRLIVPDDRRVAAAALRSQGALRPARIRLARTLLALSFRLGLAKYLLRDHLRICVADSMADSNLAPALLTQHIEQLLGHRAKVCIGLRRPGPYAKPVLQVFSPDGRSVCYVKIGWNELTRRLVRNEATALRSLTNQASPRIIVPRLLHHGTWRDIELSIVEPLPAALRRYRPLGTLPPVDVMLEIAAASGQRQTGLSTSGYWSRLRERASALPPASTDASIIQRFMTRLEDRYGEVVLSFGAWHGDWTPWNLGRLGGRLVVWDWEQSGNDVPLGFDAIHFYFQQALVHRRKSLLESVARSRRHGLPALPGLGIPPDVGPALLRLYLLEMLFRHYDAMEAGAGRNRRFYPEILKVLDRDRELLQ